MSFGLISSGVIFYHSQKIDQNQLTLQRLTQDQAKCKSIDLILSQWLTMLDLYLINKQTYLYEGLKHESDILIGLTRGIQQDLDDKHVESLKSFRSKIRNAQNIINECQSASIDTNSNLWEQSLKKTDLITENIDEAIKNTSLNFNTLIDRTNLYIEKQRTALNFTAYGILILVALITVASLRYARKSIIAPLERLSDIAEKENLHPKDFKVKGPKEVKVLSNKLGNYILALMKAREVAMSESQLTKYANARIRNIMETAGDAIICSDEKGNIIEMNQSFRKLSSINLNKYPAPKLNELIPELDLNQF